METGQRVGHTGGRKPNRIENLRTAPGGELTADDAYELDMWKAALAQDKRRQDFLSGDQPMNEGVEYPIN